jgi:L-alanine-DL-glutamate epimerase-like enolase superfamily enzyme
MSLKITNVERLTVDVGFRERPKIYMSRALWNWTVSEVCRVTTDAGIVGYGETMIHVTWGRVNQAAIDRVLGQNPADFLWDDSLGAGLQMALFDVVGKALGVPCYRLMGRKVRDWAPISWWAIDMPPEDWAGEARDALQQGYKNLKLKARPWYDIVEQVKAVCEEVPSSFKLDLDFNTLLVNAGHAVPVLLELERFPSVAIFESPIPQTDIEGNRQVRARITRPIAMHFGSPPYLTSVAEEVCDGYVIGGGAAGIIREGTLAAAANKPFWMQMVGGGLTTTFSAHLGAVLTHAQWPGVNCLNVYADDLLKEPLTIRGGFVRVPEAPGLGVEVDEEALERRKVPTNYEKPEPKRVYTVVWPDGRRIHYAHAQQYRLDFRAGNLPVFERGVWLEERDDDGSQDFADLYNRAQQGPVWDVS